MILLIPEKTDAEFEQVFRVWTKNGGQIRRLGRYWIKDEALVKEQIAIYGNQTFALVLAQIYEVELISPDDTVIARLEKQWVKRSIQIKQIDQVEDNEFPVFIKPVIPKLFIAGIFDSLVAFQQSTSGLQKEELVIISSVVDDLRAEARSFVKGGIIKDMALYEGSGDLETGEAFLADFLKWNKDALPEVVVVDIAYSEQAGWFILEFNACWGAGLNNCKADKVIDCIISATINSR